MNFKMPIRYPSGNVSPAMKAVQAKGLDKRYKFWNYQHIGGI